MEDDRIYSKSETIGIKEIRELHEVMNTMGKMLSIDEYLKIMAVFGESANRVLKENGME